MTDLASFGAPEQFAADASRRAAFQAARRHSVRVKVLRRLIVVGSILSVAGIVGFAFFNPFRAVLPGVKIDAVGLNGTEVTMENPRLEGFKSDGRPYTLLAKSATQDMRTPNILKLHDIDAHFTMKDKSVVHVVSSSGRYDSSAQSMTFDEEVHMTSDSGLDAHMKTAYVEFKGGVVTTDDPLTVVMNTGTIAADSMHLTENGKVANFQGHVHTVVIPTAKTATVVQSLKGTTP